MLTIDILEQQSSLDCSAEKERTKEDDDDEEDIRKKKQKKTEEAEDAKGNAWLKSVRICLSSPRAQARFSFRDQVETYRQ